MMRTVWGDVFAISALTPLIIPALASRRSLLDMPGFLASPAVMTIISESPVSCITVCPGNNGRGVPERACLCHVKGLALRHPRLRQTVRHRQDPTAQPSALLQRRHSLLQLWTLFFFMADINYKGIQKDNGKKTEWLQGSGTSSGSFSSFTFAILWATISEMVIFFPLISTTSPTFGILKGDKQKAAQRSHIPLILEF